VRAQEQQVQCEIEDSGEGLPSPDWTTVLMPFYSTKGPFGRGTGRRNLHALGLGLTVSRHLVELHGGHLELRSAPGVGTTAVLVLPRVAAAADPEQARPTGPAEKMRAS
jgi:two-component system cell cycle sensor histidine kinase PleC